LMAILRPEPSSYSLVKPQTRDWFRRGTGSRVSRRKANKLVRNGLLAGATAASKRGGKKMNGLDERTKNRLEFILDEVCASLPKGGDHEDRKFVAEQLMLYAQAGKASLEELLYAGQRALVQLEHGPSARGQPSRERLSSISKSATTASGNPPEHAPPSG